MILATWQLMYDTYLLVHTIFEIMFTKLQMILWQSSDLRAHAICYCLEQTTDRLYHSMEYVLSMQDPCTFRRGNYGDMDTRYSPKHYLGPGHLEGSTFSAKDARSFRLALCCTYKLTNNSEYVAL